MQPNGQMPTPPINSNPYDYLLNPQAQPQKSSFLGGGKPNLLVRVLFVLGVILLLFIAYVVFNSLTSKDYSDIVVLAERQQEIVRITDLGLKKAQDPATHVYLATVRSTTLSEQNATLDFLKKKGVKVSDEQLALKKDSSVDKALTTAAQNNTFDEVLLSKLNNEINSYQKAEKQISGTNDSKSEKELFALLLNNAKVIAGN